MQCSRCSAVVRPVVAIDIDGTLGEFHDHFQRFALRYLGLPYMPSGYRGYTDYKLWFMDEFGVSSREWRDIKLAYRQGAQKRSMPAFNWSRYLVHNVRVIAELWLCTTRPYQRLDNIDPDTRFWCEQNGIEYDYMVYGDDKYEQLSQIVEPERVVAVMDDLPERLYEAGNLFGSHVPLLLKRPHNEVVWNEWPEDQVVTEGMNALKMIHNRVEHWNALHASNGGIHAS